MKTFVVLPPVMTLWQKNEDVDDQRLTIERWFYFNETIVH